MQELASQTEKVKKEALLKYNEGELVVVENKESAVKKTEEELLGINQMKEIISKGGIETVYCYELSRLSRRPKVLYSQKKRFCFNFLKNFFDFLKLFCKLLRQKKISEW